MRYVDRREEIYTPKVGDFIYADGELRVIVYDKLDEQYQALYVTGAEAFKSIGNSEETIERLVHFYRVDYDDFELIPNSRMMLVRD